MEDSSQQINPVIVGRSFRVIGDEMNEYYCKINTQNEGRSPWRIEEHVRVKIVNIIVLCIDILTAIWLEI
jgi:hypothetical protein